MKIRVSKHDAETGKMIADFTIKVRAHDRASAIDRARVVAVDDPTGYEFEVVEDRPVFKVIRG